MVDVRSLAVRDEVRNLMYEPAIDLGDVVRGKAPAFVQDPVEFFSRTHSTESMKTLVIKVFMNLLGIKKAEVGGRSYEVSSSLILLPSDLGGGKTHSLILLYHMLNLISESKDRESVISKIKILDEDIADFISENWDSIKGISPKVVVIDCKYSDLAPGPVKPIEIGGRKIKTLWGYLGYELGRYDLMKSADERETAPYADDIFKALNESRALVLIDEIGRYYDLSGLEPTKISAFLMNLAEALSKYTVRGVAVALSLPYEAREGRVEAKAGMEYVHRPELIRAVNEVLSRPSAEIIKPVERRDLAEILRKRIFSCSREEFEKLANDFIARELNREYPVQVRKVLDDKGFWKEIRETYPFHPMFLNVIEKLAYKLPYLQRTRDAIKIAVHTVMALKEGLFTALEDEVGLIMPYHIPLFSGEALDETILRNAPDEYKMFQLILKSNVVEPENFNNIKKYGKEEFYEKIVARELRGLKEEDMRLGVKLASIIWLHSLVGLSFPINIGEFPTTLDLIYSVSPTDQDVRGVLGILRSVLPQLVIHGDLESDSARWFFASIPSLEELIEIMKKNVTDEMAKDKLAELIEDGLTGKRGKGRPPKGYRSESIFSKSLVTKTFASIPREILDLRDPVLMTFADKVSKDELLNLLKGRNNIIVLAPHVEGIDSEEKLAPEDIKGIKELAGLKDRPVWDGLLEILRYNIAAENISEDHLKSFVGEKLKIGGEEYTKELLKILEGKVRSKKDYYYTNAWNLINRCYRRVYYHRQGSIRSEEGLSLERDKPIPPTVESFLREKGLILSEFRGTNILSIVRDYLGKDPTREAIEVGKLWNFIITTDKANVPLITREGFIKAIKDLIKTLDYAVRAKGELLWKPIFSGKEEADEGSKLISQIVDHIRKTRLEWEDIELIYWENIFDEWLARTIETTPSNMVLKVMDKSGRFLDIRDIKFDPKSTIRSGRLFYEEKKYPVELDIKLPDEIVEGNTYDLEAMVFVGNFEGEVLVELKPDRGLSVEPREFRGKPPVQVKFKIGAEKAGNYRVRVEVYDGKKLLDFRTIDIPVKGEWIEEEIAVEVPERVEEGVKVVSIKATDIAHLPDLIRVAKSYPGRIDGSLTLRSESGNISLKIETEDPRTLDLLLTPINSLMRILTKAKAAADIVYTFREEPELRDVIKLVVETKGLEFKTKKRAR